MAFARKVVYTASLGALILSLAAGCRAPWQQRKTAREEFTRLLAGDEPTHSDVSAGLAPGTAKARRPGAPSPASRRTKNAASGRRGTNLGERLAKWADKEDQQYSPKESFADTAKPQSTSDASAPAPETNTERRADIREQLVRELERRKTENATTSEGKRVATGSASKEPGIQDQDSSIASQQSESNSSVSMKFSDDTSKITVRGEDSMKETNATGTIGPIRESLSDSDLKPVPKVAQAVQKGLESKTNIEPATYLESGGASNRLQARLGDHQEPTIMELGSQLISQLDESMAQAKTPQQRVDIEKKKRLVNMAIGDIEAAQEPIAELEEQSQTFFRETLKGLQEATDGNGHPSESRRLSKALESHRKAGASLSEAASLKIVNPAFCTEVASFGVLTRFPKFEFRAGQEVLLYCELENFVSKKVQGGFETQLQGNYEIIDSNGKRAFEQLLPEDTDFCANRRQDFYIAYRLHLPSKIASGKYELRLVVEDMFGHKYAQANVPFRVVE